MDQKEPENKMTDDARVEGLPVHGYKPQTTAAIEMVNRNKEIEEHVLRIMDNMKYLADVDQRWLAIARTQIEQGFMALNRAVFAPTRIKLASDTEPDKTLL